MPRWQKAREARARSIAGPREWPGNETYFGTPQDGNTQVSTPNIFRNRLRGREKVSSGTRGFTRVIIENVGTPDEDQTVADGNRAGRCSVSGRRPCRNRLPDL